MLHSQEDAVDVHANFFTNVCNKLIQQFNVHDMNVPCLALLSQRFDRLTLRTIMETSRRRIARELVKGFSPKVHTTSRALCIRVNSGSSSYCPMGLYMIALLVVKI